MTLLMAILSVIGVWAFLLVLLLGLLLIWKVLESVRISLERIAMGVRAIEQETGPLAQQAGVLAESIQLADRSVSGVAQGLAQVDADLAEAAPVLRVHFNG